MTKQWNVVDWCSSNLKFKFNFRVLFVFLWYSAYDTSLHDRRRQQSLTLVLFLKVYFLFYFLAFFVYAKETCVISYWMMFLAYVKKFLIVLISTLVFHCSVFVLCLMSIVDIVDRGNDNWLIKYEKSATTDSQPEVVVFHIK